MLIHRDDKGCNTKRCRVVAASGDRGARMVNRSDAIVLAQSEAVTEMIAPRERRVCGGISRLQLQRFLQERYRGPCVSRGVSVGERKSPQHQIVSVQTV